MKDISVLRVQKTQQKHEKSLVPSYSPGGFATYTIVCTQTEKGQGYKKESSRIKKTIILGTSVPSVTWEVSGFRK